MTKTKQQTALAKNATIARAKRSEELALGLPNGLTENTLHPGSVCRRADGKERIKLTEILSEMTTVPIHQIDMLVVKEEAYPAGFSPADVKIAEAAATASHGSKVTGHVWQAAGPRQLEELGFLKMTQSTAVFMEDGDVLRLAALAILPKQERQLPDMRILGRANAFVVSKAKGYTTSKTRSRYGRMLTLGLRNSMNPHVKGVGRRTRGKKLLVSEEQFGGEIAEVEVGLMGKRLPGCILKQYLELSPRGGGMLSATSPFQAKAVTEANYSTLFNSQ